MTNIMCPTELVLFVIFQLYREFLYLTSDVGDQRNNKLSGEPTPMIWSMGTVRVSVALKFTTAIFVH